MEKNIYLKLPNYLKTHDKFLKRRKYFFLINHIYEDLYYIVEYTKSTITIPI